MHTSFPYSLRPESEVEEHLKQDLYDKTVFVVQSDGNWFIWCDGTQRNRQLVRSLNIDGMKVVADRIAMFMTASRSHEPMWLLLTGRQKWMIDWTTPYVVDTVIIELTVESEWFYAHRPDAEKYAQICAIYSSLCTSSDE